MTQTIVPPTAGRELDAEIARVVFGCDPRRPIWNKETYICGCIDNEHNDQECECNPVLYAYSTDIAAAWLIVWEMDCGFKLERKSECSWVASFYDGDTWHTGESCGDAPEAICRAALLKATSA